MNATLTLTLTEAEASRLQYAMAAEAQEYSRRLYYERTHGNFSVSSGRLEILLQNARDECLAILRKLEEVE